MWSLFTQPLFRLECRADRCIKSVILFLLPIKTSTTVSLKFIISSSPCHSGDFYSISTRFLLLNMFRIDRTCKFPDPQFTAREISVTEAPDSCLDHSHVATQLDTILLRIFSGSDRQYPDWFEWPNTSLDQRGYVPARHQTISHWTTRLSIPDQRQKTWIHPRI